MKKIVICPNQLRDEGLELTEKLEALLRENGAEVTVVPFLDPDVGAEAARAIAGSLEGSDMVVSLGGDGTILHLSKLAARAGVPLLGINLGMTGFIAGLERDEWRETVRAVRGECEIEPRMMLDVAVERGGETVATGLCLNDAVIERGAEEHIVYLTVCGDGRKICSFAGDGIIFSSPTGSTGYSMSAGGPVVEPEAESLLMTPICAHTLSNQVFVLSPKRVLTAEIGGREERTVGRLMIDGKNLLALQTGDVVRVWRSALELKLVRIKEREFYELVNRKLSMKV
jgi:NAD+ kinase